MKNTTIFHLKIIIFTAVKYYIIMYGRVFVMVKNAIYCIGVLTQCPDLILDIMTWRNKGAIYDIQSCKLANQHPY